MSIKIFFVDDERLLLESLSVFFSTDEEFEIVGSAASAEEALEKLAHVRPDVMLVDLNMAGIGGVRLIGEVKRRMPEVRMLVLSTYYDDQSITSALSEGADGYILKSVSSGEIIEAARMVASGHTVLDQKVMSVLHRNARRMGNELSGTDPKRAQFREQYGKLTEREREICRLIQDGRSNREIAAVLHITEGTVKNYLSNIYGALGVRDRTALAVSLTRTAQSDK
jgi:DNA-binding NarL/FixJ family response regulator